MILTEAEVETLVHVQHRSPHQLLGMHPLADGSGVVVRALIPDAARIESVPTHEKDKPTIKLKRIHKAGLFEGASKGPNRVYAYDLVVTDHEGRVRETR